MGRSTGRRRSTSSSCPRTCRSRFDWRRASQGRTGMGWRPHMTKVGIARTVFVALVFAALEALCRLGIIDRVTMIPPSEMVTSLWSILATGRFNNDILFTLCNVVAAAILGFFLVAGQHALPLLLRPLVPLLSAYYAVPTFVFYP